MKSLLLSILMLLCAAGTAPAKVRVVAATSDLAYFVQEVGGDLLEVEAIARPTADLHFVEVRPSYMVKMSRADLALKVGLEMDQWMDRIIDGSRNRRLTVVDCAKYIAPLEVPDFKVDARHGDLHRYGNPHYWLTPDNAKPITDAIVEGLARVDPENAEEYRANQAAWLGQLNSGLAAMKDEIGALAGVEIVTFHNSWPYFNEYTGLESVAFVEPYPGVPPSPTHVKGLIDQINQRGVKVIGVEPYFDRRVPEKIARETGATVVTLYPSVGGRDAGESYLDWLRGNIEAIGEALK